MCRMCQGGASGNNLVAFTYEAEKLTERFTRFVKELKETYKKRADLEITGYIFPRAKGNQLVKFQIGCVWTGEPTEEYILQRDLINHLLYGDLWREWIDLFADFGGYLPHFSAKRDLPTGRFELSFIDHFGYGPKQTTEL